MNSKALTQKHAKNFDVNLDYPDVMNYQSCFLFMISFLPRASFAVFIENLLYRVLSLSYWLFFSSNPLNFVRNKHNFLRFTVHIIENCRLFYAGIVGNRIPVPIEMRFRQGIGTIGLLVHIFFTRRPKDCAVQKFCIFRRVRQTRDIEASTLTVNVGCHLHFTDVHLARKSIGEHDIHHVCTIKRKDVFLVFTVIHGAVNAVQNEMVFICVDIVFIFAKRNTKLL